MLKHLISVPNNDINLLTIVIVNGHNQFSILFFIYSGFAMTFQRRKNNFIPKNKYKKNIAEYVNIEGTETGRNKNIENELKETLLPQKKPV